MNPSETVERWVSTTEAARILGCSPSLVRWLIRMSELKNVLRPGKRIYLLDVNEVKTYRERRMNQPRETIVTCGTAS